MPMAKISMTVSVKAELFLKQMGIKYHQIGAWIYESELMPIREAELIQRAGVACNLVIKVIK
jgi:hypothetical protein